MGFAPIKWTCTAFFRPRQLTDRAILASRQTQEKKSAPLPRKRQPELPQTPSPPEPQRAKAAESKPVLQAVSPPVSRSSAARTSHDDIRQRLFSDSMQRQLFAQHVPQRPQKKIAQGTPSNVSTVPPAAPPQDAQDSLVNTTQQQPNDVAVVDLTTGADDSTRRGVTGDSSAPSQVEEHLSETTVHTPSVSDSDASRRNRLVNQAKLERLKEAKHRVAKEHKDTLEILIELDTQRNLFQWNTNIWETWPVIEGHNFKEDWDKEGHINHPKRSETALTTDDIHQLQQATRAHNELRAPMNQFMERQFANQEPLKNNLLIPTLEVRINKAAKLRGDFAQMVHTISRNFTIRDTNQIMEQLILRCQGDLNVYIQNEMLMHNHCMEIVGSLGLKMLDAMLSVDD